MSSAFRIVQRRSLNRRRAARVRPYLPPSPPAGAELAALLRALAHHPAAAAMVSVRALAGER